jgi:hypothetical protein
LTPPPFLNHAPARRTHDLNPQPRRVAGLWYLLLVLAGPIRLIYVPSKLFVHGNAAATASNIAAHEWLFRFGIISDLLGPVILIFLVLAFYRLFKGVAGGPAFSSFRRYRWPTVAVLFHARVGTFSSQFLIDNPVATLVHYPRKVVRLAFRETPLTTQI